MTGRVPVPDTFVCRACGECCRIRGYVRLTDDDVGRMAARCGLDGVVFTERYARLTDDRRGLSLNENEDGSCVFLDDAGRCLVHDVKPKQCREFPAGWNYPGFERRCRGMETGA